MNAAKYLRKRAEADKEQGKGKLCGIIEIAGDECGELGEV